MNALLICPSGRPLSPHLARFVPLAAAPLLGASLTEYWLSYLAAGGAKAVRILTDDRPDSLRTLVGNGARWGLKVEVVPEIREFSPAQAQLRHADFFCGHSSLAGEVAVLDHFPGMPQFPLFESYATLFSAMFEWLPKAATADRVGVREIAPGIWTGMHTRLSPEAELRPPCWIGNDVYIGDGAMVGPTAIVEDRTFVEPGAEIVRSVIGPDTFVGKLAVVRESFALGDTLINWKSSLVTQISDAFLLCTLRRPASFSRLDHLLERLTGLYAKNKDDLQMFWKHLLTNKGS